MLLPLFRCGTLFLTRSAQNAFHAVVPFVAGYSNMSSPVSTYGNRHGPLFGEGAGIDHRDAVVDLVPGHARETLDEVEILGGPSIKDLVGEVASCQRRAYRLPTWRLSVPSTGESID